jgi:3-dehydroquinate synthase
MGTGKTTVGEKVAERLGRPFVDTDQIIRDRLGKPIPQIFKDYGEPFFRAIEASICAEMGQGRGLVVSTGGGALVRWENLKSIAGEGNIIICLTANPDEILHRLDHDTRNRPLVDKENGHHNRKKAILELLESRREHYNRIRLRLDTTGRGVDDLVDEVLAIFERESRLNEMRIPVWTPENRYTILCERGLLNQLPQWLEAYNLRGRMALVTTENLAALYGPRLAALLPQVPLLTMPDGEQHKTLATVQKLYAEFAAAGLDRGGLVLAFGGGVVGDTAGFAAASYMRGVGLVQIPTSLLAMVDSSVGGKVGVDISEGKNLVGAFKQPELVLIDPEVLGSLPEIELQCGLAEAIKHGLIADLDLLDQSGALRAGEARAIRQAVRVKVEVVQRDPYEKSERAHLNLGHTFAHAIERVSQYQWRHGQAVAAGLLAAIKLSAHLEKLSPEKAAYAADVVKSIGLATHLGDFSAEALWAAMGTDKKWRDGHNYFILLEDIGRPVIQKDVPRHEVLSVLRELGAS